MSEHLLSWVSRIRSLYMRVHSDKYLLLKCSKGMLYTWDGYEKTFLNYMMIMMTRSYEGMLMQINNKINILICLYLIWIWCSIVQLYLSIHTSYIWHYTFHESQWDVYALVLPITAREFWIHYIVGAQVSLNVCIGIYVKLV
jgi:hypothetical protein